MVEPVPAARLRRSWPQRVLIATNLALIVVCLSGAGTLGWFYAKFDRLPRVEIKEGVLAQERPPGEPQNYLLVGSDSREFVADAADEESFGTVAGARADTLMLVRVDPTARTVAMLSFPRDLYVAIAGTNSHNRINTAFENGPEQLIETIKQNFNVPIHHYAQVDFKGFKGLVDAVGGVTVYLPNPVRDWDTTVRPAINQTGLDIRDTGCVSLNGTQALAYVRSRHFQYFENGRWHADLTGDFGRIKRQQDFVIIALREALSKNLFNVVRFNRLANVAINNAKISKSIDPRDILDLGKSFHTLDPSVIQQYRLPVESYLGAGGASLVRIAPSERDEAERILDIFRGVAPPAEPEESPASVNVQVLNGSGRPNLAGDTSSQLQNVQFSVASPGTSRTLYATTTIRYAPGQVAKAQLLQRYLKADALLEEVPGQNTDTVLVLGRDFAGVLAQPRAAGPSTTTTTVATTDTTAPPAPDC
jgi:LCP family protein required for cell wall assembly